MELLLVNSAIVLLLLVLFVSLVFLIAQIKGDNGVMDIAYGPAFVIGVGGAVVATGTFSLLPLLITSCMVLWAARLSVRIFRNHRGKPEDARYAKWRHEWSQHGRAYFLLRSYLQVNLLQAILILLVAIPGILALTYPAAASVPFMIIGGFVFAFGLAYETIADWQLDTFLARKRAGTETATLMTTGLFAYSRRPNYFGETLVWWGLAIMVLPLPYGWLGLISPLLITYIVTKVTGPMLENIFLEKYPEEYRAYMKSTNYLLPGPKRR